MDAMTAYSLVPLEATDGMPNRTEETPPCGAAPTTPPEDDPIPSLELHPGWQASQARPAIERRRELMEANRWRELYRSSARP